MADGTRVDGRKAASLKVRGVGVRLSGTDILSGVSADLHPGEMCALLGPSGAGKSTLIKVLLGILRPTVGDVRLGEAAPTAKGPVGYVPQDDALHTTLSVRREIAFAADLRLPHLDERERKARVDRVVRDVGLEERQRLRIRSLSGGQRKRVSVAVELLTRPDLLILDEPTSGLDPGLEAHMMRLFADVARSGRIVLVSTHAMESLEVCDALLLLVRGQVAYFGPPQEAPGYFGVGRFALIFEKLKQRSPSEWAEAFRESELRSRFAARAAPAAPAQGSVPAGAAP